MIYQRSIAKTLTRIDGTNRNLDGSSAASPHRTLHPNADDGSERRYYYARPLYSSHPAESDETMRHGQYYGLDGGSNWLCRPSDHWVGVLIDQGLSIRYSIRRARLHHKNRNFATTADFFQTLNIPAQNRPSSLPIIFHI